MEVHEGANKFKTNKGTVVTIGTFDGVHLGHKAILNRLVETAHKENLAAVLLTFFPHPRMVLQKDSGIKMLNTLAEKKVLLQSLGLDHLVIHPFTQAFSRLNAVEYVRDILVNQLKAKKIIIGYDHRFGRNRNANIKDLIEFGQVYDFKVSEISAKELDNVAVSSTKTRKALLEGAIQTANNYLGYPYMLNGTIVRGKGIGKDLGYPTANLKISENYKLIPQKGVYITQGVIEGKSYFGITNIGTNPTVGGKNKTVETYFLDLQANLYDQPLELKFLAHIREETHFNSIEDLKKAIQHDEHTARAFLANYNG